jgi:phytol kinase
MREMADFLLQFIPPYPQILTAALISIAAILAGGVVSAALKRYAGWPTGYTRKLLHFIIFFTAVGLHVWGGLPAVNVLGAGMGVFVLFTVMSGDGNFFFEAMAREKDFPRRGYFIVIPYLTTAVGGILSNVLFGAGAVMGYVVCGAADAIAEPVGVRFGKHRYQVPSLRKVQNSERSIEGSLAVFIVSLILAAAFFRYLYNLPTIAAVLSSLCLSIVIAFVEAISFHGADNLTIQVAASGLAYFFVRIWG